jgi:predicted DNA-binding protein (MmcQ/YjbR family)
MGDSPARHPSASSPAPADPVEATLTASARWCRNACLTLPGTTVDQPFGPETDAYRIHGKIFALLMQVPRVSEHVIVNLKAEPDEVALLVAAHDIVRPGYHMNKRHWITVELSPAGDLHLVGELIEDSYDNVVAGLPARLRSSLSALRAGPSSRSLTDPT